MLQSKPRQILPRNAEALKQSRRYRGGRMKPKQGSMEEQ
jgi:hypothetical protein